MKCFFLLSSLIFSLVAHAAPGSYSGNFEEDYPPSTSTVDALSHPRVVALLVLTAGQWYLIHKGLAPRSFREESSWVPYYLSFFVSIFVVWAVEKLIL